MATNLTKQSETLTLLNGKYSQRKFRILEIIDELPAYESRRLKKELPAFLEVSRQTFSNWCNAGLYSNVDIPFSKAYRIALVLSCDVIDLINKDYYRNRINNKLKHTANGLNINTGLTN